MQYDQRNVIDLEEDFEMKEEEAQDNNENIELEKFYAKPVDILHLDDTYGTIEPPVA